MRKHQTILIILLNLLSCTEIFAHGDHAHSAETSGKNKSKSGKRSDEDIKSWAFSLGLGSSISKPLTDPPTTSASLASITTFGVPQPTYQHEGHDGGGGDTSGSGSSASFSTYFSAGVAYRMSKQVSLNLNFGYIFSDADLMDPSLGLSYSQPFAKKISLNYNVNLSAPVSKSSQNQFKITTLSISAGPRYAVTSKFSVGLSGALSMTWYSKTVIVDEKNISPIPREKTALLHGDDEPGHAPDEPVPQSTGNREFNRYGVKMSAGYKLGKVRLDSNVGFAMIQKQFGASYWGLDATILQVGYEF